MVLIKRLKIYVISRCHCSQPILILEMYSTLYTVLFKNPFHPKKKYLEIVSA